MARETAKQRDARMTAEREAAMEVAKATYTERLMAVLERAVKANFELEVADQRFNVRDRDSDSRYASMFFLNPVYSHMADLDLYELEVAVECKEEERAEAERLTNLRATALAKLTQEERAALSL